MKNLLVNQRHPVFLLMALIASKIQINFSLKENLQFPGQIFSSKCFIWNTNSFRYAGENMQEKGQLHVAPLYNQRTASKFEG